MVNCVNGVQVGPWECRVLLDAVINLLSNGSGVSLQFACRKANMAADWLAKCALRRIP